MRKAAPMTAAEKKDARRFAHLLEKEGRELLSDDERKFMRRWYSLYAFDMIRDTTGQLHYAFPEQHEAAEAYHESKREIRALAPDATRGRKQQKHLATIAPNGPKARATRAGHGDAEIIAAFKRHKSASRIQGVTNAVDEVYDHLGYENPAALWKRLRAIASPKRAGEWYTSL